MTAKEFLKQSQIKDPVLIRVHEKRDKVVEVRLSDLLNNFARHVAEQAVIIIEMEESGQPNDSYQSAYFDGVIDTLSQIHKLTEATNEQ